MDKHSKNNPSKPAYETPRVIPLGGIRLGAGKACSQPGNGANTNCVDGGTADGTQCGGGNAAIGTRCSTGLTAVNACGGGNSALATCDVGSDAGMS